MVMADKPKAAKPSKRPAKRRHVHPAVTRRQDSRWKPPVAAGAERRMQASPSQVVDSLAAGMYIGHRLARFRALTTHPLFETIHGRLISGQSPGRLAHWLQAQLAPDDPLGSDSLVEDSLRRKLQRYARLLPKSTFLPPSFLDDLLKGAQVDVDLMAELAGLIAYQKTRITFGHAKEQEFGFPSEQLRREVHELADLLRQYRDTAISLGMVPGAMLPMQVGTVVNVNPVGAGGIPLESTLERMMAENPQMISEVMPALRMLESITLPDEAKDVTPAQQAEKEATDGSQGSAVDGDPDRGKDRPPADKPRVPRRARDKGGRQ